MSAEWTLPATRPGGGMSPSDDKSSRFCPLVDTLNELDGMR
jgi:hypothetical protein